MITLKYNFDQVVNRKGSNSVKWDNLKEVYGTEDILPMWIADMDFKAPDEVIEALQVKLDHGVFGYNVKSDSLYNSIINWVKNRYNWNIKKEWISFTPGVVTALNIAVKEFAKEGEKIVIQPPVYPPFFRVLENNNVEANLNPLIHRGDKFVMDYDSLEKSIDDKTKAIILCNPHNPVGRVWTKEELSKLGEICLKKNIIIISDEIHGDLTYKDYKTTPMASVSNEIAQNTITFMAPSKTFNIAGLATSIAIIPNEKIREVFERGVEKLEIGKVTTFGSTALEAAYTNGGPWLEAVMEYIEDNADYAIEYINKNIPEIKVKKPEGTYLLWLDFKALNKTYEEIHNALVNVGKVALNDGFTYGDEGNGFFRINIACARSILEEGLERVNKAVQSLK